MPRSLGVSIKVPLLVHAYCFVHHVLLPKSIQYMQLYFFLHLQRKTQLCMSLGAAFVSCTQHVPTEPLGWLFVAGFLKSKSSMNIYKIEKHTTCYVLVMVDSLAIL